MGALPEVGWEEDCMVRVNGLPQTEKQVRPVKLA
jgi:hypothetical protein